jgi:hypothetical protein|nr:MAG TPA: indolepyruvate oxidoreductase subunit beta [Caudoviricetes sp.]
MSPNEIVNDTILLLKVRSFNFKEFYLGILYNPMHGWKIAVRMVGIAEVMWKYPHNPDHDVLDTLEGKRFSVYFFPAYKKGKKAGEPKYEGATLIGSFKTLPEAIEKLKEVIAKDFCEILESNFEHLPGETFETIPGVKEVNHEENHNCP